SSVPTTLPTAYDVYPLDGRHDGGYYTVKDCVTIDVLPRRSEERFSRNAETDLVCRLLLEKKKNQIDSPGIYTPLFSPGEHCLLIRRIFGVCSSSAFVSFCLIFFFFTAPATTEIYTLSLHDALPIFFGSDYPPDCL